MSEGFIVLMSPSKPSMIYSGSLLPIDFTPRILTCIPAPALPPDFKILTPATLPCKASAGFVVARLAKSSPFTEEIAPVMSLFFIVP